MPQDHQYAVPKADWLDDRKKLRKDWYNYLKAGEEKLKSLLKDRDWTINYPNIHDYFALHEQSNSPNTQVSATTISWQWSICCCRLTSPKRISSSAIPINVLRNG